MAQEPRLIPTLLLTGFLGAGKTTLLNRLIDYYHSQRTVLLINEFGEVGIDGALLHQGNYQKIELNKGSLFCICVRTDFIAEVERIADELDPDLLIIEATGLADTSEMERMLALPNLRRRIRLQASICLVDPQNFLKISTYLKAPLSQVRNADLVLINKIDRVDAEELQKTEAKVREIAPNVPVVRTSYAEFDLALLQGLSHSALEAVEELGEGRPDPVLSLTLEAKGSFAP
ncbi:GTP-binding protein, partial [candidate division KSB1 bacterium]|nr:GTP-binding protein [candidate division KSB1 bacterium]